MSRAKRKKLIKEIEDTRGTKVITYVTSDRPNFNYHILGDIVPIMHEHIHDLENGKDNLKLDLFIYSRGGDSNVPWTVVSMFREYARKGSFSVLIPFRAHSAATMIALGADEIVMTKKAELGPIDITTHDNYNPKDERTGNVLPISVEDVNGYFDLLDEAGCKDANQTLKGFELLADNVHPIALGSVSRLLKQTKLVATRLLNTRSNPFPEEENNKIVKKLSSEIYSHQHAISRSEAKKYIGLKQVKCAENENIDKQLWSLYEEYKNLFKLEKPLMAEEYLVANDLEEHKWKGLNQACIESYNRSDVFKQDLHVRTIKEVPPEIQIGLNNLNLPPINIPALPSGITPDQINQLVINAVNTIVPVALNNTVPLATKEVLKALPRAGFESFRFNSRWKRSS